MSAGSQGRAQEGCYLSFDGSHGRNGALWSAAAVLVLPCSQSRLGTAQFSTRWHAIGFLLPPAAGSAWLAAMHSGPRHAVLWGTHSRLDGAVASLHCMNALQPAHQCQQGHCRAGAVLQLGCSSCQSPHAGWWSTSAWTKHWQ